MTEREEFAETHGYTHCTCPNCQHSFYDDGSPVCPACGHGGEDEEDDSESDDSGDPATGECRDAECSDLEKQPD